MSPVQFIMPIIFDTTCPRSNMPTSEGLPQRWRLRTKKLAKIRVRFLTVNIGPMTGKSRDVVEMLKRRQVEIACVHEAKWKGNKAREIGEGCKLYCTAGHQRQEIELVSSYIANGKIRSWP